MLTQDEIIELSKNPNQGFDICAVCGGTELANTMKLINENKDELICEHCGSDILTYEEWVAVSVMVSKSNGQINIFSLQERKSFLIGDAYTYQPILEDKNERGALFLKIYNDNYVWIQQQHQKWLKEHIDNLENNT